MSEEKVMDGASLIATESTGLEKMLPTIKVDSPESHALVQEGIDRTYRFEKQVHEFMDQDVKNAHTTWDGLTSKRKRLLDLAARVRKSASDAVISYEDKLAKESQTAIDKQQLA